jgi:hypothetical protein
MLEIFPDYRKYRQINVTFQGLTIGLIGMHAKDYQVSAILLFYKQFCLRYLKGRMVVRHTGRV